MSFWIDSYPLAFRSLLTHVLQSDMFFNKGLTTSTLNLGQSNRRSEHLVAFSLFPASRIIFICAPYSSSSGILFKRLAPALFPASFAVNEPSVLFPSSVSSLNCSAAELSIARPLCLSPVSIVLKNVYPCTLHSAPLWNGHFHICFWELRNDDLELKHGIVDAIFPHFNKVAQS